MTTPRVQQIEDAIAAQVEARVDYLRGRCEGVADIVTALTFLPVIAPAARIRYMGKSETTASGVIGLPVEREFDLLWHVYLVASSFRADGEGRLTRSAPFGAVGSGGPGTHQMVEDVFGALQGFLADPAGQYDGARLLFMGDDYRNVLDGKVVWEMRFRQRLRLVGTITS